MSDHRDEFGVTDPRFETHDVAPVASAEPDGGGAGYEEERRSSGCGCVAWGCLGVAAVVLTAVIGLSIAGYYWLKAQAQNLTAEEPVEIPVMALPEDEIVAVQERFDAFADAMKQGDEPVDLELTGEEINGLIAANDDLRGRVLVRIEEGQIGGDVSIPIDQALPVIGPMVGGRFLNASIDAEVSLKDGELVVRLIGGSVNGVTIPQQFIDALAEENLAQEIKDDPDAREVLERFESIEVRDDRIVLRPRRDADDPAEPAAEIETFEDPTGVE